MYQLGMGVAVPNKLTPAGQVTAATGGRFRYLGALLLLAPVATQAAPTISSISADSFLPYGTTQTYYRGDAVVVQVDFSEAVKVEGQPRIALQIGSNTRHARFIRSDSTGRVAFFRYFLDGSDTDSDGYSISANAFDLDGGSIKATSNGDDAVLTHDAVPARAALKVDGTKSPTPEALRVVLTPSYTPRNGIAFTQGERIGVWAEFSRAVGATGRPRVKLTIGSNTRYAEISDASRLFAQHRLLFEYTVQSSDLDSDGISIPENAISLNGGKITHVRDTQTHANLDHDAQGHNADFKVDGSQGLDLPIPTPYLNPNFAPPAPDRTYGRCSAVYVFVPFQYNTVVTGDPTVRIEIGSATREAEYLGRYFSDQVFVYYVQASDTDTDGIAIPANSISLNGASIVHEDFPTVEWPISPHPAHTDNALHKVNGQLPPPNKLNRVLFTGTPVALNTYALGEPIYVWANFSQAVKVTGAPKLNLTIGSNTRQADFWYVHNPLSQWVLFDYVVQASDTDADGIAIPANAMSLNGGSIVRPCDSGAPTLTHDALAADSTRKVDGSSSVAPTVTSAAFANRPNLGFAYGLGEKIEIYVTYDRAVTVTGSPRLGLTVGGNLRQAGFRRSSRGGRRLLFDYRIQRSDDAPAGVAVPADSLELNGGTIRLKGDSDVRANLFHSAIGRDYFRQVRVTLPPTPDQQGKSGVPADRRPLQLALWTDRPAYRPGETVRLYRTLAPHDDRGRYRTFVYLERPGGGDRRYLAPLSAEGELHAESVDQRGRPADSASARSLSAADREIRDDLTLRADTVHYLQHQLFVHDGATLAIEPGTVVQAWGRQAAIIVLPGGRIVAEGTREAPVVLTCSQTAGWRQPGCWGGLRILGGAPVTRLEGLAPGVLPAARAAYGGSEPEDSSGALRYVRVEFAGAGGDPDEPEAALPAIGLYGAGSGTILDHVQVRASLGDGLAFHGGTAVCDHCVASGSGGAGLSWQRGWRGGASHLYVQHGRGGRDGLAGGHDGQGHDLEPRSLPTLSNVTLVHAVPYGRHERRAVAVLLSDGSAVQASDLLAARFGGGAIRAIGRSRQLFGEGESSLGPALLHLNGAPQVPSFLAEAAEFAARNPKLRDARDFANPDPRPKAGSPALTRDREGYIGAFDRTENWLEEWTVFGPESAYDLRQRAEEED